MEAQVAQRVAQAQAAGEAHAQAVAVEALEAAPALARMMVAMVC